MLFISRSSMCSMRDLFWADFLKSYERDKEVQAAAELKEEVSCRRVAPLVAVYGAVK